MTKEVLLSLKGLQFDGESEDDFTTIVPAEYYERNGKHYVIYEEILEGFHEPTKNILKFWEQELEVTRRGVINVHLLFEENRKNLSNYGTPFGELTVGIYTTDIQMRQEEERIRFQADFDLELNYQHQAECKIVLDIRPFA